MLGYCLGKKEFSKPALEMSRSEITFPLFPRKQISISPGVKPNKLLAEDACYRVGRDTPPWLQYPASL